MNMVLYHLACADCSIMDGWHPTSSKGLAKACGLSLKETLKELRKLKAQGLAKAFCEAFYNEYREHWQVYWGWGTTLKAHDTDEFKKAWAREREICKKCFDIDIGEGEKKYD